MRDVWKRTLLLLGVVVLLSGSLAGADDINAPSWRGLPGTSWAQWEFETEWTTFPAHPAPDDGHFPFGDPTIDVTPGAGAGWFDYIRDPFTQEILYDPCEPSGHGWYNLSGEIEVRMENTNNLDNHKEVWIQLTWQPQAPGNRPILEVWDDINGTTGEFTNTLIPPVQLFEDPVNDAEVWYSLYHVDRQVCPPFEYIKIRGGINVDELVIDTWCLPEPTTMGLLTLGVLALVRRRRAR